VKRMCSWATAALSLLLVEPSLSVTDIESTLL
jgi:hypothetical protein